MTDEKQAKQLTPKEAVLKFCSNCVGGEYPEIARCKGDKLSDGRECTFYKYRLRKGRPTVKTIRKECIFCMNGDNQLIRNCTTTYCPLYRFRLGSNPSRSGIGFQAKKEDDHDHVSE